MPGARALLSSFFAAIVVGSVAYLWLHWPGFVAVGVGALFGVASLIVTGSLEPHAEKADEAWRAAAPDLHARAAASTDPESPGRHAATVPIAPPVPRAPAVSTVPTVPAPTGARARRPGSTPTSSREPGGSKH